MSNSGITLGSILASAGTDIDAALRTHLGAHLGNDGGGIVGLAASIAAEKLGEALAVDPFELIARAWASVHKVREAAEATRRADGPASVVHLGEHAISDSVDAVLEIELNGVSRAPLRLTLDYALRFRSVALSISRGAIGAVAAGEVSAVFSLRYKETKLGGEHETAPLQLPGRIDLAEPVVVGAATPAA